MSLNVEEERRKIAKAKLILKEVSIRGIHIANKCPYRPLLIVSFTNGTTVTYNHKGWMCDHYHKEIGKTWGCSLNKGAICSHIIAAQFYLRAKKLDQTWMNEKDFFYLLSPLFESITDELEIKDDICD